MNILTHGLLGGALARSLVKRDRLPPLDWYDGEGAITFEHLRRTDAETRQAVVDRVLSRMR